MLRATLWQKNTFAEEITFKQFERYFHIMVHC